MFSTTKSTLQHEHKTYFQQGSQEGHAFNATSQPGNSWRETARGDTISPWVTYTMTFLAGLSVYPLLVAVAFGTEFHRAVDALDEMVINHQNLQQLATQSAKPRPQSVSYSVRFDPDGQEVMMDSATLISRLDNSFIEERLRRMEEGTAAAEEIRQTQSLLDSANDSQLKVHKALFSHLTSGKNELVVLDDALLESHPIILSDQTRVPANKAALMRVVDKVGKNRVLILGVDLDYHKDFQSVAARFPGDCYDLDEWLCNVADELARGGNNAEDGVAIYLYSNRVIVDVNHETGFRWMTRYKQSDFPSGFPLRQMRMIEQV